MVAEAIHTLGNKSKGPFIRVNCAALSESLLEVSCSDHVKGASPALIAPPKDGLRQPTTATSFWMKLAMSRSPTGQVVEVLIQKEFERVGDYRPVEIDVRIIARATRT